MGLFDGIKSFFGSLNKSRKLRDIYDRIEGERGGGTTKEATGKLREAREDLFDLVLNNSDLSKMRRSYDVDEDELRELYHVLEEAGAAHFTYDGHYVAGSSIAFGYPLDFVLRNKDTLLEQPESRRTQMIARRIVRYFENAEQGRIEGVR